VTVGRINVNLNAGTYYIVFTNTFSSVSNKAINCQIAAQ